MELQTTASIRAALMALPRAEWDVISAETGVPRSTIEKIAYGVTEAPNYDQAMLLATELRQRRKKRA